MKLFVKTFGCQMNEYDSARMIEGLRLVGWEPTADMKRADLMLFNSCSIREKAVSKLASALGRAAAVKRRRPDALLAVTGYSPAKGRLAAQAGAGDRPHRGAGPVHRACGAGAAGPGESGAGHGSGGGS